MAAFEPSAHPFVSLYLNTQADQHGRDNFESFGRKEFKARAKANAQADAERARRLSDEYRTGGLATVGVRVTRAGVRHLGHGLN